MRRSRRAARSRWHSRSRPRGAEFAYGSKDPLQTPDTPEPDPEGAIERDQGLIGVEGVLVPTTAAGDAWRLHLVFSPQGDGHWNNEAEPMRVWLDVPDGWSADQRMVTIDNANEAASAEVRTAEFELRRGEDAVPASDIRAYALYNVCEGEEGVCLFRRLECSRALE